MTPASLSKQKTTGEGSGQPPVPKNRGGATPKPQKTASKTASFALDAKSLFGLFSQEDIASDIVEDEADARLRHHRLMALIRAQALAIGILVAILVFGGPIMKPFNRYFTLSPERKKEELTTLYTPNLTNQAILSWAATSVTEVMTIGFGDYDRHIRAQRKRFTAKGWESFQKALKDQRVREEFLARQIVLTTVPADVAVIVNQGPDPENGYQWTVEMPVIMTYVTNNNVSKKSRSVARITIVRVPSSENVGGAAIKKWTF